MKFTTSDGLSLAYDDAGTGVPVLCLCGLTRNMSDFDDVAAQIGDRVRLIRMDYRGRGASDYAEDYSTYSIPVEARDALELLDHLGLDKALILGTSRGGLIGMLLAMLAKDRLLGVILNDIGPKLEEEGLTQIMGFLGKDPNFQTYEDAADALPEANAKAFPGIPRERWRICAERWWVETEDGLKIRYDARLRDAVIEGGAMSGDPWALFDALDGLPIGLIRGETSTLFAQETAAEMARRRPDMAFASVPDRGHVPFLDEPEAVAVIDEVLAKL